MPCSLSTDGAITGACPRILCRGARLLRLILNRQVTARVLSMGQGESVMENVERRNYRLLGQDHPNAKLSTDDVRTIRKELSIAGTSRAWVARQFGVSRTTVDNIARGRTWRSVVSD